MKSVCIFLGANSGINPVYTRATIDMGRELAQRNLTCIYGGSDTGLMKLLADSVLDAGGGSSYRRYSDRLEEQGNLSPRANRAACCCDHA